MQDNNEFKTSIRPSSTKMSIMLYSFENYLKINLVLLELREAQELLLKLFIMTIES